MVAYKYMGGPGPASIWACGLDGDLSGLWNVVLAQHASKSMSDPDVARLGTTDTYQVVRVQEDGGRGVQGGRVRTDMAAGLAFDIHVVSGD